MSKKPSAELPQKSDLNMFRPAEQHKEFEKVASTNKQFAEKMIKCLLECKGMAKTPTTLEIMRLAYICKGIFKAQRAMIEIDGPVKICGDLHGQFPDLIRIFAKCGWPPESNYLFLGDYVDRGQFGLETLLLCLSFKARYPQNFFMLRGNHELRHINTSYGFADEVHLRKGEYYEQLYAEIQDSLHMMPFTALVGGRILCMHGGITKRIKSLDMLRDIPLPWCAIEESLENDLLWSDPDNVPDWTGCARGTGTTFGNTQIVTFCEQFNIDLIVRAHQCVQDGYEFFGDARKLVTVFSAPHYMGTFTNYAAVCCVSEGLEVSFEQLIPEGFEHQECVAPIEPTAPEMSGNPSAEPI
ncbi:unnamed protein product [Caenorhabditis sp. 36 PRJEB53466]|nr:unnamed protein product [Caenorhabditis sp. 36 PRJEB53466]